MGLIKALTAQYMPSFFYRGKAKDSVSVAELAIANTFKTQMGSNLSPSHVSVFTISPAAWSTRSKVEIAALLLFFSYQAASLLTTTAVNTVPPFLVMVLLGIVIFRICQISMKNLIQNTALNVAAGTAMVVLGPNPTGYTPEDDFDGIVHNMGVLGVFVIPDTETQETVALLPEPEEVLVSVAAGMTKVALGPNPMGYTPEDDFDGVVHNMGVLGVFMIPDTEAQETVALLPEPEEALVSVAAGMAKVALGPNPMGYTPEDDFDGVVQDMGALGMFIIPNAQPKKPEAPLHQLEPELEDSYNDIAQMVGISSTKIKIDSPKVSQLKVNPPSADAAPEEEIEETSDWAASMGGFFFGMINVIGVLFLL